MPSLIRSSIRHNWRTHLGVVLGCALAALVLTGALMVGDSVKGTLKAQAEARVGKIGEALLCGERFVPWSADKAKRSAVVARMFFPGENAAGVLLMQGSAVRGDGKARANKVQVVGVDEDFWKLAPGRVGVSPAAPGVPPGASDVDSASSRHSTRDGSRETREPAGGTPTLPVALNQRLAAQLSLKVGDELSLYVEKPGAFSKDAPLSGEEAALVTVKARVARIVGDEDFGRFALTASQVPPNTVFVPLGELQAKVGLGEKVNVIFQVPDSVGGTILRPTSFVTLELGPLRVRTPFRAKTTSGMKMNKVYPSDSLFGLESDLRIKESHIRSAETGWIEIRSPRVFLDPAVVAGAQKAASAPTGSIEIHDPPIVTTDGMHTGTVEIVRFLPPQRFPPILPPPPGLDSLTYFVTAIETSAPTASDYRSGDIPVADSATNTHDTQTPKNTKVAADSKTPSDNHAVGDKNAFGGLAAVAAPIRSTPYSMVTALDAPASGFVQAELADDEIQISRWLADDLEAKPGDTLTLRYSVMGERRELIEKTRTFTILAPIIEMEEPQLDSSWMPDFPNIPDKDSFSKWKPGFPFDSKRIRKKDEEYWAQHRGTPKAFINLKVGQEMWGNRWGNLTSIRYPAGTKREQVERIAAFIDPKALGFRVVNLREQALAATDAPVDFGQLFASFSFFLIAAAAVLTGLLFTFTIEQRAAEAGLLLAVGWTRKQVRRLFLKEGALLAIIGSTLGVGGAALYTKAVLAALGGVWSGATGGTAFIFVVNTGTVLGGIIGSVLMALFAMWLASRRIFKNEAAALMSGEVAK
jgi:ABC-type lipoprotein release transport system permease subunit